MRSPATALLWASWRLTRGRLLFTAAVLLIVCSTLFALPSDGSGPLVMAVLAVAVLVAILWPVSTRLLGDRSGFPFLHDLTRPVRTPVLVAVPMVYMGAATAALYAVPLLALATVFGIPFPIWPQAARLCAFTVLLVAAAWWTPNRTLRQLSIVVMAFGFLVLTDADLVPPREQWADAARLEWADLAMLVLACAVAFAVGLLGVARQRHGDQWLDLLAERARLARAAARRLLALHRHGWGELFWARCPSSSPLAAELWLEMKYRGAPMLAAAILLAAVVPLAFAVVDELAVWALVVLTFSIVVVPMAIGVNASPWTGGRAVSDSLSGFEAARPASTARLAGLQVLTIAACALAGWCLMALGIWASLPLLRDGEGIRAAIARVAGAVGDAPLHRLAISVGISVVWLATAVALLLAFKTLAAKHGKAVALGLVAIVLYAVVALVAAVRGWIPHPIADALLIGAPAAALPLLTLYLLRRTLLERILTYRQLGSALLVWAAFAALHLATLQRAGMLGPDAEVLAAALLVSATLVPLGAFAFAPWSLGLMRHA